MSIADLWAMDAKELLEAIKTGFADLTSNIKKLPAAKLKFAEVTTADGQTLSIEGDLAEGAAAMIGDTAAPDGDYTLEDGTVITISGGVISKLTPLKADENADAAGYAEKFSALETKIAEFETKFEAQNTATTEQMGAMTAALEAITSQLGKQVELMGKFSEQTATPAEPPMNRLAKRMDNEARTGKTVDEILSEINKAKTN